MTYDGWLSETAVDAAVVAFRDEQDKWQLQNISRIQSESTFVVIERPKALLSPTFDDMVPTQSYRQYFFTSHEAATQFVLRLCIQASIRAFLSKGRQP